GGEQRPDDGRDDEGAEDDRAHLRPGGQPPPQPAPSLVLLGHHGRVGADRQRDGHRAPSLALARGSMTTMITSTIMLASRTAKVITRKIACISGKSFEVTALSRSRPMPG